MANVEIDGVNSIVYTDQVDPKTGTTLTLGTSGDTVNLGTSVTAGTGFGGDLSFGGDTFGANKVIGANDAYSFSLETSGNTALTIDADGHITMPLQSSFHAYPNSTQSNIATGSDVTVIFQAEIFDQNSDYNTTTYTFTAPVTGKYLLTFSTYLSGFDTAATYYVVRMITSNYNFNGNQTDGRFYAQDGSFTMQNAIVTLMDANDTAYLQFRQDGGSAQTDIVGGGTQCWFTGCLLH